MDENVLSSILEYNQPIFTYNILFKSKTLQNKETHRYKTYVRTKFTSLIIHTFSSLYYMHFLRRPRSREEINHVFLSLDYHGLFQDPDYYDLEDYLKVFKIFVERAFDYNVERQPLYKASSHEKTIVVSKYSSNSRIKNSRTLYALNLM